VELHGDYNPALRIESAGTFRNVPIDSVSRPPADTRRVCAPPSPMTSIEVFHTAWGAMQRIQQPFISPSLD